MEEAAPAYFISAVQRVNDLLGEGGQVVGFAAGDQGPAVRRVDQRLAVAPVSAGVGDVGTQARPAGQRLAFDHSGLDEGPRPVADRGDRFAGGDEPAYEID